MVKNNREEVVNQVTLSKQTVSELSAFMDALSSYLTGQNCLFLPLNKRAFPTLPKRV